MARQRTPFIKSHLYVWKRTLTYVSCMMCLPPIVRIAMGGGGHTTNITLSVSYYNWMKKINLHYPNILIQNIKDDMVINIPR